MTDAKDFSRGLFYAICAFSFWGIVPLFWKQLVHVDSIEIVVHRMLWSFVIVGLYVVVRNGWQSFAPYLKDRQLLIRLALASIIFSTNAGIFIWAVLAGYVVESSMGYFINPLINVVFGVMFFNESLRPMQWLAILLMVAAVAYLMLGFGAFPWIALSLAITFASYGAIKKTVSVPSAHGMSIETAFLLVPCVLYLLYLESIQLGVFGDDVFTSSMLIMGGLVTLIPLLLFSAAAKLISMTALGMTQYIGPTIQLIIGVWVYNEDFGIAQKVSFGQYQSLRCRPRRQ